VLNCLVVVRFNGFSKISCGLSRASAQRRSRENLPLHRPTNSERFHGGKLTKSAMQLNRTNTNTAEIGRHSWWFDWPDSSASMTSARFAYKRGPAVWRHYCCVLTSIVVRERFLFILTTFFVWDATRLIQDVWCSGYNSSSPGQGGKEACSGEAKEAARSSQVLGHDQERTGSPQGMLWLLLSVLARDAFAERFTYM